MSQFVPVDPTLDAQGRITVLVPMLGDAAVPYPKAAPPVTHGIVAKQFMHHTTLRGAASLGVADFFKLKAEGLYEAAIYTVAVGVPKFMTGTPPAGTKIISTMWGVSLRVAMRIRSLDASVKGGFGSIAAAVEMRAAEVEYSLSAVGTDRAVFAEALKGVPSFGTLNYSSYTKMKSALASITDALITRVANKDLPLLPIAVGLHSGIFGGDVFSEGRAHRWTMKHIANKIKLATVLTKTPPWVPPEIPKELYAEFGVNSGDVSDAAAQRARVWLGGV